jgi:hypothetical protein
MTLVTISHTHGKLFVIVPEWGRYIFDSWQDFIKWYPVQFKIRIRVVV